MTVGWSAAVLCGGASRRMGRDKATIEIDGRPMAQRVADAALAAGAERVVAVGGRSQLPTTLEDLHPGEGPLGAVLTALHGLDADLVLVLACDLLSPSPDAMAATVAALAERPDGDVAVPTQGGIPQWHHAAWRSRTRVALGAVFAAGERAVHGAVAATGLVVVRLPDLDPAAFADADSPADLL